MGDGGGGFFVDGFDWTYRELPAGSVSPAVHWCCNCAVHKPMFEIFGVGTQGQLTQVRWSLWRYLSGLVLCSVVLGTGLSVRTT